MNTKIVRTSKTRVSSLQSFKSQRPKANPGEPAVKREEVSVEESSVGDLIQDVFGDQGTEVKPDEISSSASKPHVRKDDEPDDQVQEEDPPKSTYSGDIVQEGVNSSQVADVKNSELDDLISRVNDGPPAGDSQPSNPKRPTSTPSKDNANDADFGEGLSLIRGDDYEPTESKGKQDEASDKTPTAVGDSSKKPVSYGLSTREPLTGGRSITTTVTTTRSYSSRFVPSIPESFYKDIQSRLEDLIFKFECLDNEYAALQKISHKLHGETMEIKSKFSREA